MKLCKDKHVCRIFIYFLSFCARQGTILIRMVLVLTCWRVSAEGSLASLPDCGLQKWDKWKLSNSQPGFISWIKQLSLHCFVQSPQSIWILYYGYKIFKICRDATIVFKLPVATLTSDWKFPQGKYFPRTCWSCGPKTATEIETGVVVLCSFMSFKCNKIQVNFRVSFNGARLETATGTKEETSVIKL